MASKKTSDDEHVRELPEGFTTASPDVHDDAQALFALLARGLVAPKADAAGNAEAARELARFFGLAARVLDAGPLTSDGGVFPAEDIERIERVVSKAAAQLKAAKDTELRAMLIARVDFAADGVRAQEEGFATPAEAAAQLVAMVASSRWRDLADPLRENEKKLVDVIRARVDVTPGKRGGVGVEADDRLAQLFSRLGFGGLDAASVANLRSKTRKRSPSRR
jgi:hypothetical protein